MGIYNRDNINYGGFLQAAIANKIHNAERQAEQEKAIGELWGDTIAKAGETIGRGAFYSYGGDSNIGSDTSIAEDKAELAKLEEIQKKYNEQVAQRKKFDEIFNNPSVINYTEQTQPSMVIGYNPYGYNRSGYGVYPKAVDRYDEIDNPYALPGNTNNNDPGEYLRYKLAMDRIFGGR